jgi:DUF4097 and DUF4098 domain-containing protein YvlB
MCLARKPFALLVPFTAVLLVGCHASFQGVTVQKDVSSNFQVGQTPRVIVDTFNGSIEVVCGVEDGVVRAKVTKKATAATEEDATSELDHIDVKMRQDGDTVVILAQRAGPKSMGNLGAPAHVEVPKGTLLDLRSSNGGLKVIGLAGDVIGKTSNGKIEVKGSKSAMKLSTNNGGITVDGGSGKLDLESSNSGITIVKASQAQVNAKTSNGKVQFQGTLAEGEHLFESSNGNIVLTLPAEMQFRLDATTSNGKIRSDFPVKGSEKPSKKRLRGVVGDGQATSIKVHTSNGSIELKRE